MGGKYRLLKYLYKTLPLKLKRIQYVTLTLPQLYLLIKLGMRMYFNITVFNILICNI